MYIIIQRYNIFIRYRTVNSKFNWDYYSHGIKNKLLFIILILSLKTELLNHSRQSPNYESYNLGNKL